jgi:hypothetical protein
LEFKNSRVYSPFHRALPGDCHYPAAPFGFALSQPFGFAQDEPFGSAPLCGRLPLLLARLPVE